MEKVKGEKVLITGSSGMLGTDLSQALSERWDLFGLDMAESRLSSVERDNFLACDITDKEKTIATVTEIGPCLVVHTAAWTDVDGCELDPGKAKAVNSLGTENVALACSEAGSILVYMSTDFVFDGKKKEPYREDDPVNPLSAYAASKWRGEEAVRRAVGDHFIVRTSWLFGKNGPNFVDTILKKAETERELRVVGDQVGSPTYTKDLAKAIGALLEKISEGDTRYGTYHVSNAGSVSWYDYAGEILRLRKIKVNLRPISSSELGRPAKRPPYSVLDNGKFVRYTGYKMRPWQNALRDYLKG